MWEIARKAGYGDREGKRMKREVDLEELKRLYGLNDMVRADCGGCVGCSACCRGMGTSVVLDPYDIYRLETGLSASFSRLLEGPVELHVEEGVILPNLKMSGAEEACVFLDGAGRCGIHPFRPGLCRIFPLGRVYEEESFRYYLQIHQCPKQNRAKIKVKKWIDEQEPERNERFILQWHRFLKTLKECVARTEDEKLERDVTAFVLQLFYGNDYDGEAPFFQQFESRLEKAEKLLAAIEW